MSEQIQDTLDVSIAQKGIRLQVVVSLNGEVVASGSADPNAPSEAHAIAEQLNDLVNKGPLSRGRRDPQDGSSIED